MLEQPWLYGEVLLFKTKNLYHFRILHLQEHFFIFFNRLDEILHYFIFTIEAFNLFKHYSNHLFFTFSFGEFPYSITVLSNSLHVCFTLKEHASYHAHGHVKFILHSLFTNLYKSYVPYFYQYGTCISSFLFPYWSCMVVWYWYDTLFSMDS